MAPDADTLRQRRPVPEEPTTADDGTTPTASAERICGLEHLRPAEVSVDGVIYDLTDFDHPGGESIMLFGGNDVTVQYKMIHPYHTEKHLQKMKRVGKVADHASE